MKTTLTPLFRFLLPLAVGIGIGEFIFPWCNTHFRLPLATSLLAISLLLAGTFTLWRSVKQHKLIGAMLFPLAAMLCGILLNLNDHHYNQRLQQPTTITAHAVVAHPPRATQKAWRTRVRLLSGKTKDYIIEVLLVGKHHRPRMGEVLLLHTQLRPLTSAKNPGEINTANYLRQQGVDGEAVCFEREWQPSKIRATLRLSEKALCFREQLLEAFRTHFSAHDFAVITAMTLGNRHAMDAETRALYSETGSSHILALSGLHLAILFGCYQLTIVAFARRKSKTAATATVSIGVLGIWCFAFVTGFPTSLVRACCMLTAAQIIGINGFQSRAFHSLCLAMVAMLIYRPSWLFDVGFQLSCLAVTGIVLLCPLFPPPQCLHKVSLREAERTGVRPPNWLVRVLQSCGSIVYQLAVVSLSAQIATAPLVAHYFHLVPWVGVLASFVVIPISYALVIGSATFVVFPFGKTLIASLLSSLLYNMEWSLRQLSQLPLAHTSCFLSWTSVAIFYAIAMFEYQSNAVQTLFKSWGNAFVRQQKKTAWAATSISFLLLSLLVLSIRYDNTAPPSPTALRVYRTSGNLVLHAIAPDRNTWLWATDTAKARLALSQTARNEWQQKDWHVHILPLSLLTTAEGCQQMQTCYRQHLPAGATPLFGFAPRLVLMGHTRLAFAHQRLSSPPRAPLAVDILVLGNKLHMSWQSLSRFYTPRLVVLSDSWENDTRLQLIEDLKQARIPVFDTKTRGMFSTESNTAP